jgi:predicted GIY-YIG superfamily endonuclease
MASHRLGECPETRNGASRRERQLKRWTRRKKEALIEGDLELLKKL